MNPTIVKALTKLKGVAKATKGKAKAVVDDASAGYKNLGKPGRPRSGAAAEAGRKAKKGVNWAKENPGKATGIGIGAGAGIYGLGRDKKAEYVFQKLALNL